LNTGSRVSTSDSIPKEASVTTDVGLATVDNPVKARARVKITFSETKLEQILTDSDCY
jgi:hypothetical protein